ncbi:hypothetical protein [Streptomyces alfalfae]
MALPGHFVVGFGPPDDLVLAGPFAGGRVLTGADAGLLVAAATGKPPRAVHAGARADAGHPPLIHI